MLRSTWTSIGRSFKDRQLLIISKLQDEAVYVFLQVLCASWSTSTKEITPTKENAVTTALLEHLRETVHTTAPPTVPEQSPSPTPPGKHQPGNDILRSTVLGIRAFGTMGID
jgi:hypothetical protein